MATKITPFLWFNNQAEEAAKFYTSVFKNSKINTVTRYGAEGPGPKDSVMTVDFTLDGQELTAINGGSHYTLTPAISFVVHCRTQQEIDEYWDKLLAGGEAMQCGWLTDRFGLSWQITPTILLEMIQDKNAARKSRVMQAMMQMVKLDIQKLKDAYERA
ncbi:MAG TPA: VOC family protein [Candidatus Polarisedimenticolia bacterium]|nr:VOC family protein [Candidatus Polarisedimenticolia bacterium]